MPENSSLNCAARILVFCTGAMGGAANALLLVLAPLPSALAVAWLRGGGCPGASPVAALACEVYWDWHPLAALNALFFLNVCVGFWLASLVQRSTWLIDPYWTLLPPLIAAFARSHPRAVGSRAADLQLALLLVWGARLTWSYLRREEWRLGAREDWRFAEMRRAATRPWLWMLWSSFWVVYVSQQLMLVGLTLSLWPVYWPSHARDGSADAGSGETGSLGGVHALAAALGLAGVWIAARADSDLRAYMVAKAHASREDAAQRVLDQGLWRLSRHPNYFGEQLWWYAFALFAVPEGAYWAFLGPVFNSIVMAKVTLMTEDRMLRVSSRRAAYLRYCASTSVWLPWPWKFGPQTSRLTRICFGLRADNSYHKQA